jgi:hypothetical protein
MRNLQAVPGAGAGRAASLLAAKGASAAVSTARALYGSAVNLIADVRLLGLGTAYAVNAPTVNSGGLIAAEMVLGGDAMAPSATLPRVAGRVGNAGNGAVDLATSRGTWGGLPATPAAQGFAGQLVRSGDMVPLPRGSMGLQDLGSLASSEGAEFAVIRLNGDRYIVRGTANTTTIPEGSTLIGHVHPGEGFMGLAPSVEDMSALGLLNQGRSVIFNESGAWRTFGPNGPSSSVFMPKPKTTPER